MHKVLVIAVREYLATVQSKTFLVSLLMLPLLMGGGIAVQTLLHERESKRVKTYAVVDRTPGQPLFQVMKQAVREYNTSASEDPIRPHAPLEVQQVEPRADVDQQRLELSEKVRQGRYAGFLEIGPEVLKPAPLALLSSSAGPKRSAATDNFGIRYQSKQAAAPDIFPQLARLTLSNAVEAERCREANVPPAEILSILAPVPFQSFGLSERNPRTGVIEEASTASQLAPLLLPVALMGVMFMLIMVGATPLMQGVVEEKMLRIAEVLLGSVRPFALMTGKLIGMVAVSLTIAALYLAGGYWAAGHYGFLEYLSADVLVWFIVFLVLALLFYGSLFIAIGAACTDMKETQTLTWPVVLLACLPMFMSSALIMNPNNPFVIGVSFFPPATPMLMIARQAVAPGIPWWQLVLGIVGVLLTTVLCVYAAGRIFRVGLLMQGKGARVSDLLRWVIRG